MAGKAFIHRSAPGDVYETPYSMTQALLNRERFPRLILEPACGPGAIVRVLSENGHDVHAYDAETNFLAEDRHFRAIITNPPYSLADEFVAKAQELRPRKFAMLLRTNWLSGQARLRAGLFDGLARVYVFSRMPDLRAPIREDGKFPTAGIVYAWMVWTPGRQRPATVHHIDNGGYVLTAQEAREPPGASKYWACERFPAETVRGSDCCEISEQRAGITTGEENQAMTRKEWRKSERRRRWRQRISRIPTPWLVYIFFVWFIAIMIFATQTLN